MDNTWTNWIRRFPLLSYFALVFAGEWLVFFTLSPVLQWTAVIIVGSWLPNIVGLLVTVAASGRSGLRELGRKIVLWRIAPRWYFVALLVPVLMAAISIAVYALLGGEPPKLAPTSLLLPILAQSLFTGALGEELGWRGTALPRLQGSFTPLLASLILGALWALYHLPVFFLAGSPHQETLLLPFMIGAVELTVLVTWTFNRTRGSLLPVFLYHFSFNFVLGVTGLPTDPLLFWLFIAVGGLMAIAVIALDWSRFSRSPAPPDPGVWAIRRHRTTI